METAPRPCRRAHCRPELDERLRRPARVTRVPRRPRTDTFRNAPVTRDECLSPLREAPRRVKTAGIVSAGWRGRGTPTSVRGSTKSSRTRSSKSRSARRRPATDPVIPAARGSASCPLLSFSKSRIGSGRGPTSASPAHHVDELRSSSSEKRRRNRRAGSAADRRGTSKSVPTSRSAAPDRPGSARPRAASCGTEQRTADRPSRRTER